jgi:hypothetical protein
MDAIVYTDLYADKDNNGHSDKYVCTDVNPDLYEDSNAHCSGRWANGHTSDSNYHSGAPNQYAGAAHQYNDATNEYISGS